MELGNWALISSPSLLALLPLIIFIVFALLGKGNYLGMFLGIIVGFFLTGQDLVSLTNAYTAGHGDVARQFDVSRRESIAV